MKETKIVNQAAEIMASIGAYFPEGLKNSLFTAAELAENLDQGIKDQFKQALDENETIGQAADQVNIVYPVAIALYIELDFDRELTDPLLMVFILKELKINPEWLTEKDIYKINLSVNNESKDIIEKIQDDLIGAELKEVRPEDVTIRDIIGTGEIQTNVYFDGEGPFINIHKESLARLLGKFGVQAELSQEDIALYFQLRDHLVKAGAWV